MNININILLLKKGINSFVNKDEVKVTRNRIFNPDPPAASLNTERFMFAVNIDQLNQDFVTRPYFNITVKQIIKEKIGNTQVSKQIDIELEPCTSKHWDSMTEALSNFTSLFKAFGNDFLCPVLGQKMQLQGMWGSNIFQYIEVQVQPCVSPNDSNQKWNPTCATATDVELETNRTGFHGMNFYHSNYVLNADQPDNYFTPYINDKLYFMFVPNKQAQNCDIYFQDIEVITDESLLPTEDIKDIKFLTQENNDVRETTQLFRNDDKFITLTLRMSPYVQVVTRQYKKVSQLMSELGGFIQIVFTCVGILLVRYNNFRFTIDLANNLYQFDKDASKEPIEQNRKRNKKKNRQLQQNFNSQSQGISPSKQLNSIFFKDSSAFKNISNESQGVRNQKDQFSSISMNLQNNNNNCKQNNGQIVLNNNNNKLNSDMKNNPNPTSIKNNINIELMSNISLGNCQQPIYPNNSKTLLINNFNKDENDRPIDKFKRVVEKISKRSKIFLEYMENEKDSIIKRETQTQQERNLKEYFLINQFHKILKEKNKFEIGFKYFLYKISIGYWFNNEYNKYITKATQLIHTDLDIINILDKIQQIDKIKSIIFTQDQQALFNFYQSPKIQLDEKQISPKQLTKNELQKITNSSNSCFKKSQNPNQSEKLKDQGILSPKIHYNTVNSYKQLYTSFLKLNNEINSNTNPSRINKKLIKFLGPELLNIFFQSQSLDNQAKLNNWHEYRKIQDNRNQHASSIQKQATGKETKSVFQGKIYDNNTDNSLAYTRNLSVQDNSHLQRLILEDKNKLTPQRDSIDLSVSDHHNNPHCTQGELKKIKTINLTNTSQLNISDIKFPIRIESLQQQFSFHQSGQDLGSEDDNPEIEPPSSNIYENSYKMVGKSYRQQGNSNTFSSQNDIA